MSEKERLNPIHITDSESGQTYTLEFSRESVRYAEQRKFNVGDVTVFPLTAIPDLFHYAFRMHHPNLSRRETDRLLEQVSPLSVPVLERLTGLYRQPLDALLRLDGEAAEKNGPVTLEL